MVIVIQRKKTGMVYMKCYHHFIFLLYIMFCVCEILQNPFPQQAAVGGLATLHEGQELGAGGAGGAAPAARLTHDALLATQSRRLHSDVAP